MQLQWECLYDNLIVDLDGCKQSQKTEAEFAECGFGIAMDYWIMLMNEFLKRVRHEDQEEIEFFKYIKPKFTIYLEYFMMISQGLLFVPESDDKKIMYWTEESGRCKRFLNTHGEFICYYNSGQTQMDTKYFLQRNNHHTFLPKERIYNDKDCRSSHDHLVRGWLAGQRYENIVQKKLVQLKK